MGVEGEKLNYNGDNAILQSPINNAISYKSIIMHVIALLIKDNKIILFL